MTQGHSENESSRLHAVQVIGRLAERFGGPQRQVRQVADDLDGSDFRISVIGTNAGDHGSTLEASNGISASAEWRVLPGYTPYAFAPAMPRALGDLMQTADLVHIRGMYTYPASLAARMARRRGIPYVVQLHGAASHFHHSRKRWKKAPYERFFQRPELQRAAAVIAISKREQADAQDAFGLENVRHVRPWFDLPRAPSESEAAKFDRSYPGLRGRRLITLMGRLGEEKGVLLLLKAFDRIAPSHPEATLVLAGVADDGFESQLRAQLREAAAKNQVLVPGFISGSDKAVLLSRSALFVLPSVFESFGLAAVEAMAAGVPVVVTPGVEIAEEVKDWKAGLVPERTLNGLEGALRRILEGERNDRFGARGQALVAANYGKKSGVAALSALYRELVNV